MDMMAQAFDLLSRGVIVSIGSTRHFEVANFLNIDEHFEALDETVKKLGFRLRGENGYFYLSRTTRLSPKEAEGFVNTHRRIIVAISILKQIFPLSSPDEILRQTDFIAEYHKRLDETLEEKMRYLFGPIDKKSQVESFFKLLENHFVLERSESGDKDSYKILNAINYYVKIVESAF